MVSKCSWNLPFNNIQLSFTIQFNQICIHQLHTVCCGHYAKNVFSISWNLCFQLFNGFCLNLFVFVHENGRFFTMKFILCQNRIFTLQYEAKCSRNKETADIEIKFRLSRDFFNINFGEFLSNHTFLYKQIHSWHYCDSSAIFPRFTLILTETLVCNIRRDVILVLISRCKPHKKTIPTKWDTILFQLELKCKKVAQQYSITLNSECECVIELIRGIR